MLECVTWSGKICNSSMLAMPSHEKIRHVTAKSSSWLNIVFGKYLLLKLFAQKKFKTWKTKSWKLQSLSRLGDMELQICQVLNTKESELWWLPRLENKSNCIRVLEDQVMKEISLGKGLIWKIFNPKGVKTWEAKSWMLQSCQDRGTLSCKHV